MLIGQQKHIKCRFEILTYIHHLSGEQTRYKMVSCQVGRVSSVTKELLPPCPLNTLSQPHSTNNILHNQHIPHVQGCVQLAGNDNVTICQRSYCRYLCESIAHAVAKDNQPITATTINHGQLLGITINHNTHAPYRSLCHTYIHRLQTCTTHRHTSLTDIHRSQTYTAHRHTPLTDINHSQTYTTHTHTPLTDISHSQAYTTHRHILLTHIHHSQ